MVPAGAEYLRHCIELSAKSSEPSILFNELIGWATAALNSDLNFSGQAIHSDNAALARK